MRELSEALALASQVALATPVLSNMTSEALSGVAEVDQFASVETAASAGASLPSHVGSASVMLYFVAR